MYRSYLLHLLLFIPLFLFSQKGDESHDVLYLKNKEIYRGVIVKNEMGIVSLEIDENGEKKIRQFQLFEIEKIEKSKPNSLEGNASVTFPLTESKGQVEHRPVMEISTNHPSINTERVSVDNAIGEPFLPGQVTLKRGKTKNEIIEDPFSPIPYTPRHVRVWTRQIRGFRGFIEIPLSMGIGQHKNNSIELSKSIGFQFNPIIYLGAGVAYKYSFNGEASLPVFINPRINLTDRNNWNPFWDVKGGYSPLDGKGAFASTAFGIGIVAGKKRELAFNLSLVYSYQKANFKTLNRSSSEYQRIKEDYHSIGIAIGFEY